MSAQRKASVLVVEDSPVAQMLLVHILNSDPGLGVVGTANSGEEALEFLRRQRPDVIVMDIHMQGLDGYETTRRIMATNPVPIVICSASLNPAEVAATFRALDAGALALAAKPAGPGSPEYESVAAKLQETVKLMSEVRVVKRWPRRPSHRGAAAAGPNVDAPPASGASMEVVAIGASTGGPPALQAILAGLPKDFPAPVLVVQHISSGFLEGLAGWLAASTRFPVRIGSHGEQAKPGCAYLAPDGYHMGLRADGTIELSRREPENGLRPSVSYLFRSVAATRGRGAVGVLLTGMGRDGVDELRQLRDVGAVTFAQDAESSVVHGMPGEAIKIGAASYVLSPDRIAAALAGMASRRQEAPGRPGSGGR